MNLQEAERLASTPIPPALARMSIPGATGEQKVAIAEALHGLASSILERPDWRSGLRAAPPGPEAFSIAVSYTGEGLDIEIAPKARAFRALFGPDPDLPRMFRVIGSPLGPFQSLGLRALKAAAPESYARAANALLDRSARDLAGAAVASIAATLATILAEELPPLLEPILAPAAQSASRPPRP